MSKPQNPLIKLLQQLGLARFLGLAPTERHHNQVETETSKAAAPKKVASSSQTSTASIQQTSNAAATATSVEIAMPEDSVLKRHYLATQQAQREEVSNPYPSDSVLRRHYDTEHRLKLNNPSAAFEAIHVAEASAIEPEQAVAVTTVEEVVDKSPVLEKVTPVSQSKPCVNHIVLPQDSVLKRHFLQCLTAEIEAGLSPSPTDSVLRRHHDALVQSELQKRLAH